MNRERLTVCGLAALAPLLLAAAPGSDDRPPEMNQLRGIVVFKEDGRPAAGTPVVMAHGKKGYVYLMDGELTGGGGDERILEYFIKRNSKRFCVAITDDEGRFTLANIAAADEPWNLAAGDAESGFAMQVGVRPQDYLENPLRIEIDKPAYLTATLPAVPKPLRADLRVGLAPERPGEGNAAVADEDVDAAERVYFHGQWRVTRQKPVRIGPLPGGQRYRVAVYASGKKVPYQATMFARTVTVAPGATEDVVLESAEGASMTGQIVSTDDKPLAQVNVMVETADGLTIGALTDDRGKYELLGVPAGTHNLKLLRHAERKTPG